MAFIPVPNTVLVELVYNQAGETTENTLYFEGVAPPSVEDMTDIAEQVVAWWDAVIAPLTASSTSLVAVRVTDLTTQFSPGIEYNTGLPIAGDLVVEAYSNNATAAITFRTALRGRNYRGRNYIVGLNVTTANTNIMTPASVSAYIAGYGNLRTNLAALGWNHVVVSRYLNNAPRATGVTTEVETYTMNDVVDSQRRRLPGRGN